MSLEPLLAETPNWVCCLVLQSNFALLLTIQFASLFFFFFRHDFVRVISLEPLLTETPNWVCCLVLRSNFALLLTIQFALLISSLINIISLLLTTFDWTKVRGIAPRSHTGRPRTCLVIILPLLPITKMANTDPGPDWMEQVLSLPEEEEWRAQATMCTTTTRTWWLHYDCD